MIWSDPRPTDKKIRDFYSTEYRKEYKGITKPKKKHVYRDAKEAIKRFNYLKEILNETDTILDIGAGNGVFVYSLRKLGYNAKGIEPDENHAKYAREELKIPVATGFAQDINNLESFDVITLHHVLEHLTDPAVELKNISRMLKREGYFVVEVPNAEDIRQDPKNRYHKAHIYTFNPETLVALGTRAGFRVIKKTIAPLNGNISIIFQKNSESSDFAGELDGNYSKITKILNTHTTFHHFTSPTPYLKIFISAFNAICEQVAIQKINNDTDIIDTVIFRT